MVASFSISVSGARGQIHEAQALHKQHCSTGLEAFGAFELRMYITLSLACFGDNNSTGKDLNAACLQCRLVRNVTISALGYIPSL